MQLFIGFLAVCLYCFLIVIVGGLTRLTNSGLSITEWEILKGIFPPMNKNDWEAYFDAYKRIPQYELINSSMTLGEFKVIFYWEYAHRILARLIGIFFLVPLIYFYFTKKIKNKQFSSYYFVAFLIILQGLVGWYMVKSGLVNDITVSHYRLSLHLTIAILIISIIYWQILILTKNKFKYFFNFQRKISLFSSNLFNFFANYFGAFVSGLDAGKIYQTWPLMGEKYFPDDLLINSVNDLINFETHSL